MKIQPIDFNEAEEPTAKCEVGAKPIFRSRFKWLFERPFSSGARAPAGEKPAGAAEPLTNKDGLEEFEPSSVCLAKMVQNFMEENNEKQQQRCGRKRCICLNGNCTDSSDDEPDLFNSSSSHACDTLKSLVPCICVSERNLLADTAKIVERHKINKRKDAFCRKLVADDLTALGYDASICKSKWEKSPSFLAGEYEYVDVLIGGERLIIDIDFKSEFAIARPTKAYKLVLQALPSIFIGKPDRLEKIIGIVSDAAKQSLKKKGMPVPPWRKADYIKSKWLSPFTRTGPCALSKVETSEVIRGGKSSSPDEGDSLFAFSNSNSNSNSNSGSLSDAQMKKWELPQIRPKSVNKGVKIVTGLASVIDNKP
ncbi:uncharacterized protein LOC121762337 isoform X2 [Salvia splendens]|uniref:uncharacterized protein LOC121762337 isoform X2 n=1 Tax=Salvia splendens TaxID=180675 RepID=UPI001C27D5DA|nr:uncharacterized protein LOC121762337 isoform X2 [Salvia splendens]